MATETSGNSNGFLYFIVGVLLVAVVVVGFMVYSGGMGGQSSSDRAVERSADAVGDAAGKIGDAAKDAAKNTNPGG